LFERFKAELVAHVGGAPTFVQAALIERCCWLHLQIAMLDGKLISGAFTEQDSKVYLAWANTLARTLSRLGLEPAGSSPPDPMERLAAHFAQRAGRAA